MTRCVYVASLVNVVSLDSIFWFKVNSMHIKLLHKQPKLTSLPVDLDLAAITRVACTLVKKIGHTF